MTERRIVRIEDLLVLAVRIALDFHVRADARPQQDVLRVGGALRVRLAAVVLRALVQRLLRRQRCGSAVRTSSTRETTLFAKKKKTKEMNGKRRNERAQRRK
jgi:hypothetical protein